jgi:hypothetical protein
LADAGADEAGARDAIVCIIMEFAMLMIGELLYQGRNGRSCEVFKTEAKYMR